MQTINRLVNKSNKFEITELVIIQLWYLVIVLVNWNNTEEEKGLLLSKLP